MLIGRVGASAGSSLERTMISARGSAGPSPTWVRSGSDSAVTPSISECGSGGGTLRRCSSSRGAGLSAPVRGLSSMRGGGRRMGREISSRSSGKVPLMKAATSSRVTALGCVSSRKRVSSCAMSAACW